MIWRVGGMQTVDVHRDIDRYLDFDAQILPATVSLDDLHCGTLELLAMLVADRAQADLDQSIRQALFCETGEG